METWDVTVDDDEVARVAYDLVPQDLPLLAAHMSDSKSKIIEQLEKRVARLKHGLSQCDAALGAFYESPQAQQDLELLMSTASEAFCDAGMVCDGPDHSWPEDR